MLYGPLIGKLHAAAIVLDIGCGNGALMRWLFSQSHVVTIGVDSSTSQVAQAKQYLPHLEVTCEDGLS